MDTDVAVTHRFDRPADTPLPDSAGEIVDAIFDPARRGELYPLYHRLREIAPVHRCTNRAMRDVWLVTRYADALDLYRNPRAVSDPATAEHFNHGGEGGAFYQMLRRMMLFLETDQHAFVRRIAIKAFTPRAIAQVRPITEQLATQLLDQVHDRGSMDIVTEFAYRLPLKVIALILGVADSDMPIIERYAYDFARGSELAVEANERSRRADAAAIGFHEYFADLIEHRRRHPGDDVLSDLIAAEDGGDRLDRETLIATSVMLMQAGHETTTDSIGNALIALFRNPDQLRLLRNEPDLTKAAVEELLRFDPTNQMNNRVLLDDTEVGDVAMRAGDHVAMIIGAANRDPEQFNAPDRLDLRRDPPQHLAFAFGAYYCVGNALARTEVQVALRALLDRFPNLQPGGDTYQLRTTLRNRGPHRLVVSW